MEQIINKIRNKKSLILMICVFFDTHPFRLQRGFYLYQQKKKLEICCNKQNRVTTNIKIQELKLTV